MCLFILALTFGDFLKIAVGTVGSVSRPHLTRGSGKHRKLLGGSGAEVQPKTNMARSDAEIRPLVLASN